MARRSYRKACIHSRAFRTARHPVADGRWLGAACAARPAGGLRRKAGGWHLVARQVAAAAGGGLQVCCGGLRRSAAASFRTARHPVADGRWELPALLGPPAACVAACVVARPLVAPRDRLNWLAAALPGGTPAPKRGLLPHGPSSGGRRALGAACAARPAGGLCRRAGWHLVARQVAAAAGGGLPSGLLPLLLKKLYVPAPREPHAIDGDTRRARCASHTAPPCASRGGCPSDPMRPRATPAHAVGAARGRRKRRGANRKRATSAPHSRAPGGGDDRERRTQSHSAITA